VGAELDKPFHLHFTASGGIAWNALMYYSDATSLSKRAEVVQPSTCLYTFSKTTLNTVFDFHCSKQ
jgi:hypothetical protein